MKLICGIVVSIALIAAADGCVAAQTPQLKRIGWLTTRASSPNGEVPPEHREFLRALRDLGYIEGKTIVIEHRHAGEKVDRLPALAAELVGLKVSIIVAAGTTAIGPAIKATKTVPILMLEAGEPVTRGFVKSLSLPGGNVTGLASSTAGMDGKRLELLKDAIPSISRVALLNPEPEISYRADEYDNSARLMGVQLQSLVVKSAADFEEAFIKMAKRRPDGLVVVRNTLTIRYSEEIVNFAREQRLPSMYAAKRFVQRGGLMSYGVNYGAMWQRAAVYLDKILKGANPATLPVEPPQLELVINLKTAQTLGITIPPGILLEANEVIK